MNLRRVLLVAAVACLLLNSVASVAVVAQTGNESGNVTDPSPEGGENATGAPAGNSSGGSAGGSSGGLIGGAMGAVGGAVSGGFQAAADFALGPIFTFVLDIPVLEIGLTEPGPIHPPDNWPYNVLFPVFYVGIFLPLTVLVFTGITFASFGMAPAASMPWMPWSTYGLLSRGVRAFAAILGGIVFHLTIFAALHDLFAGFTNGVAPSPGEMIAQMGLLEFSLATAVTGMGLYELGWDILKWIAVEYAIIWLWLAFFPMFSMPLTAMWLYSPRSTLGKFSGYLHLLHLAFLFSKAAVAVELYAASRLDWGVSFEGITAAALSLGLIGMALLTPPLVLIFMILSKNRMIAALGAGAGAAAGSSIAAKARQKAPEVDVEQKKEQGKSYAKRKAAQTQGKYWDVKNRAQALGSVASGSAAGAAYAGKERFSQWRGDDPGAGSSSKTATTDGGVSPTRSERMRRFEEMNDRAGGLTDTQRKRYFNLMMEDKGAFDSGLDNSDSRRENQ